MESPGGKLGRKEVNPMPMRKIINHPDNVEDETIAGLLAAFPNYLKRIDGTKRGLIRIDAPIQGKVAITTGGGSGKSFPSPFGLRKGSGGGSGGGLGICANSSMNVG